VLKEGCLRIAGEGGEAGGGRRRKLHRIMQVRVAMLEC